MTSPARWMMTVSPSRMSLRSISSSLWSVACWTTTPPTVMGSRSATGVSVPRRPTWMRICFSTVCACCAGNLCAMAQRGARDTKPSRSSRSRVVHLVDDAVDVVGQLRALLADLAVECEQRIDAVAQLRQRIDGEAPAREMLERVGVRLGEGLALLAPGIGEEFERPARGDRGIELAQRACGGVARIGEDRLAFLLALLVEREEARMLHIDFAAHLDHVGPAVALQLLGHGRERADVGGDVLAGDAVAARRRQHQLAALVADRGGKPVDLGLGHDLDLVVLDPLRHPRARGRNCAWCGRRRAPRPRRRRCRATASACGWRTLAKPGGGRGADAASRGCRRGRARESALRSPHCAGAARRSRRPKSRARPSA